MKREQTLQTYARRSLWLQALDIVEPNELEQQKIDKTKVKPSANKNIKQNKKPVEPNELEQQKIDKTEIKPSATEIKEQIRFKLELAGLPVNIENYTKRLDFLIKNNRIDHKTAEQVLKTVKNDLKEE